MIAELKKVYRALGFLEAREGTVRYRLDQAARSVVRSWRSRTGNHVLSQPSDCMAPRVFDPSLLGLRDIHESGWYRHNLREVYKGFRIDPCDTVLDVGCGDGGMVHFCANFCDHVIVADIDPVKVASAEKRLRRQPVRTVTALVSDAHPLPLDDETATKVISTEVIEHVDDPAQFLRELVRVGKPGAQYLLSVPDAAAEYVQKRIAPEASFQKPNHIRILQRQEFAELVSNAGLIIESQVFYGFFWAMFYSLFWPCNTDYDAPRHPVLDSWCATWKGLLDLPQGQIVKEALDAVMPKSQVIIARKP